jgi:hypothetical protein
MLNLIAELMGYSYQKKKLSPTPYLKSEPRNHQMNEPRNRIPGGYRRDCFGVAMKYEGVTPIF